MINLRTIQTRQTHSIWDFLADKTICGKPVQYEPRPGGYGENDRLLMNVALELKDITCPICREKKAKAMR